MNDAEQLGRYRLEALTSQDDVAQTYRAQDALARRTVTLKVFRSGVFASRLQFERFARLARQATELVHPQIAWVWEANEAEGQYFLAERFVEGEPLESLLAQGQPLPWGETMQIARQCAQGLSFAHERKVVHGSLCPETILISDQGGAIVSGFGMAALPAASRAANLYLAPEQRAGEDATPASDQYTLGWIVFCLLVGRDFLESGPPAEGSSLPVARSHGEPTLSWPRGMPPAVRKTLGRALAGDPPRRYATILDFIAALEQAGTGASLRSQSLALTGGELARLEEARRNRLREQQEVESQARQATEEAARLAAIAAARQEIEASLSSATAGAQSEQGDSQEAMRAPVQPPGTLSAGQRLQHRRHFPWLWALGGLALLALVALGWSLAAGGLGPAITPTQVSTTSAPVAAPAEVSAPTEAFTPTSQTPDSSPTLASPTTAFPTRTLTSTPLPSPTPTLTPSAIPSSTPSPPPQPTRERFPENDAPPNPT